jgi:hypothetical protein
LRPTLGPAECPVLPSFAPRASRKLVATGPDHALRVIGPSLPCEIASACRSPPALKERFRFSLTY